MEGGAANMKYRTINEWEHFDFSEAYISDIQKINGCFQMTLDQVVICPENSKNRDIRKMRTNGLLFQIQDGNVESLIEEGYRVYNADGKLLHQYEDQEIPPESWNELLKSFTDGECSLYQVEKSENLYTYMIDASNDHSYILRVSGARDIEEWDKFFNL